MVFRSETHFVIIINRSAMKRMEVLPRVVLFNNPSRSIPTNSRCSAVGKKTSAASRARSAFPKAGYYPDNSVRLRILCSLCGASNTFCPRCISSKFRPGEQTARDSELDVAVSDGVVPVKIFAGLRPVQVFEPVSRIGRTRNRNRGRPTGWIVLGRTFHLFSLVKTLSG